MGTTQLNNSEFDESFTEKSVRFDSMAEQTTSKQDAKILVVLKVSVSFMEGHIELIHTKDLTIELREEMRTMVLLTLGNLDMDLISCIIQKKNLMANAVMVLNLIRRQNFIVNQDTMENLVVILMVLAPVNVEIDLERRHRPRGGSHGRFETEELDHIPRKHPHGFGPRGKFRTEQNEKQFHRGKPGNRECSPHEDLQSRMNGNGARDIMVGPLRLKRTSMDAEINMNMVPAVDLRGNWKISLTIPKIMGTKIVFVVIDLNIVDTDLDQIIQVKVLDIIVVVVGLNAVGTNPSRNSDQTT
ncbi:16306_t:CDS:2 [Acaulospora colombiana]|uniref:16306_t:CDS:1 n=1 Tax=Acaulospora colombiana TaxID=27376 RepID=A0ACA9JYR6_9GLOM|nr:16306_t:CDS:2 [Acaulospora colombiana]